MHILSMTQHMLQQHGTRALGILDSYWRDLARDGQLPLWSDVDPGQIQDALEYAFMADCVGRCHARLRVAGGAVSGVLGQDFHGLPLSMIVMPNERDRFGAALRRCFEDRIALELCLTAQKTGTRARMVLYPLADTTGTVTRILGGLVCTGDTGPCPCRFDLTDIRDLHRPYSQPPTAGNPYLRLVVNNA